MQTQLTAPLDAPRLSLPLAGGKGANLNAMARAGFAVPAGFVVLTPAYRRYVADNTLTDVIADPGWTPVFSVIGAAVIEIGSMLSHAAIVAREYGLPAVVNIPQATQFIHDGQTIHVDGDRGRVTLLR